MVCCSSVAGLNAMPEEVLDTFQHDRGVIDRIDLDTEELSRERPRQSLRKVINIELNVHLPSQLQVKQGTD